MSRKVLLLVVGLPVALVVLAVGGTFVYINLIKDEAPARLTIDEGTSATTAGPVPSGPARSTTSPDGAWKVGTGSEAGYRVKEVLFGQSTEGVGRTSSITGGLTVSGATVTNATFTVDMASVKSDSGQRDGQFRGRIMETSRFPTAVFTQTAPITLPSAPAADADVTTKATGTLLLHGETRPVTFDVKARWSGATIVATGSIPIRFTDYGIDDPSGGPAQVGAVGELEFRLVLTPA